MYDRIWREEVWVPKKRQEAYALNPQWIAGFMSADKDLPPGFKEDEVFRIGRLMGIKGRAHDKEHYPFGIRYLPSPAGARFQPEKSVPSAMPKKRRKRRSPW